MIILIFSFDLAENHTNDQQMEITKSADGINDDMNQYPPVDSQGLHI